MTKVSIVLSIEDGHADVIAVAKSLFIQEFLHWELLIVARDGFSYKKYLQKHGLDDDRIQQHFVIGDEGKAYTYGIERASGEYITLMDQKERYYPLRLKHLLESKSNIAVNGFIVSESGVVKEGLPLMTFEDGFLVSHYYLADKKPSLLFRRSLAEYVGSEALFLEGKDAFHLALLAENDGADMIDKILHEIRYASQNCAA